MNPYDEYPTPDPDYGDPCPDCLGMGGDMDFITAVERIWYRCDYCDGEGTNPDWGQLVDEAYERDHK